VRFTQFYKTSKYHSPRVSLLTGRWRRQAGDEEMSRAMTLPEVLAPAGCFTVMTGKWHLANEPTDYGFQRFFGHLSGVTDFYRGDETFRLNGKPWTVPEEGFYTTVANVDHALTFIGEARLEKKPWFLYVAFNAPHASLQPLEADYKNTLAVMTSAGTGFARRVWRNRKSSVFLSGISSHHPDPTTSLHGKR
jgi:arylsulfatase